MQIRFCIIINFFLQKHFNACKHVVHTVPQWYLRHHSCILFIFWFYFRLISVPELHKLHCNHSRCAKYCKKILNIELGVDGLCEYIEEGKSCLQKSLDGIFFSSCLCIMHIKVVFISVALICLQRYPMKCCIAAVPQSPPAGREWICITWSMSAVLV